MKLRNSPIVIFTLLLGGVAITAQAHLGVKRAPNGLKLPHDYWDWQLIASSHRNDNDTLRVVLGNDTAVEAVRAGDTNPWPDGAILAKLVWKDRKDENWPAATMPGEFVHAEFMYKESAKFADTGGWGWARWVGMEQKPYGENAEFSQECIGCHMPVKDRDYVFTTPAQLPY